MLKECVIIACSHCKNTVYLYSENDRIKVVAGIRRSGKNTLLFEETHIMERCIRGNQIGRIGGTQCFV